MPTTSQPTTSQPTLLTWLVRLNGLLLMSALLPIMMPVAWMRSIHDLLGIGTFPSEPIVVYLARSLSATYALHGLMTFFISFDLVRYRPLLVPLVAGNALFGLIVLAIDITTGMPWFWTLCEGPPIVAYSILIGIALRNWDRVPLNSQPT